MRRTIKRRSILSIATAFLFASQLLGCAVLPERLSGFKEPTLDQQTDIKEATKYAQKVNDELLSLHDQYVLTEDALIAAALGSGMAFGIATAFNGTKDLLAALGLAGGGLVAIDYASSAPQKIKIINEGRAEILCAMNTAPRLATPVVTSTGGPARSPGRVEDALTASTGVDAASSAEPEMFDLAASVSQIRRPRLSAGGPGFKHRKPPR